MKASEENEEDVGKTSLLKKDTRSFYKEKDTL